MFDELFWISFLINVTEKDKKVLSILVFVDLALFSANAINRRIVFKSDILNV